MISLMLAPIAFRKPISFFLSFTEINIILATTIPPVISDIPASSTRNRLNVPDILSAISVTSSGEITVKSSGTPSARLWRSRNIEMISSLVLLMSELLFKRTLIPAR